MEKGVLFHVNSLIYHKGYLGEGKIFSFACFTRRICYTINVVL